MKCCKCKAEIPDQSRFCMVCGAEQSVVKDCPNCGAKGLPVEALFCPHCGRQFVINNNTPEHEATSPVDFPPKKEDYTEQWKTGDSISLFFPLYGITLGKTTMLDAQNMGYTPDAEGTLGIGANLINKYISNSAFVGEYSVKVNGARFYKPSGKSTIESVSISLILSGEFPPEWEQKYNISFSSSFNKWKTLLDKLGFIIMIPFEPQTKFWHNPDRESLYAVLIGTSKDKKMEIRLHFSYGNKNNEGCGLDSNNSLDSIFLKTL
ncbi:MAG: zinc ribbon domain-containing protein [Prevotella sp.]|nr:zinc ribbon domain-containing protein [Prevotella sp.]